MPWRNGAGTLRGLLLDWRRPPARSAKYEVIVASDVLYERPYGALVARVIATMLAPKGRAFIADPGRVARDDFIAALAPLGLRVTARSESIYR